MVEALEDGDFRVELAEVVGGDPVHVHHLHRPLVVRDSMGGKIDRAVATLAELRRAMDLIHFRTASAREILADEVLVKRGSLSGLLGGVH